VGGQEDLDKSLKAIMAARREELSEPPTPDELLAYRDGRLDPAERQRLETRIAVFPDASRALADLATFPAVEPAPGTPELSEEEIGARWQAFRERLPERAPAPSLPWPLSPRGREGEKTEEKERGGGFSLKLAAAVLAALAIGGAAGYFSGRASREVPGSAINVNIAELSPVEEGGSRSAPATLEVPEGSEELVLVLATPVQKDFSEYEAEILDAKGARLWSRPGLRPTAMGTFQVSFRRGALRPGKLSVRLFGREGKGRTLLGTYEVTLVPSM
jgi:anti-sigma factor RsiW